MIMVTMIVVKVVKVFVTYDRECNLWNLGWGPIEIHPALVQTRVAEEDDDDDDDDDEYNGITWGSGNMLPDL